jgi:hypothetical protein
MGGKDLRRYFQPTAALMALRDIDEADDESAQAKWKQCER